MLSAALPLAAQGVTVELFAPRTSIAAGRSVQLQADGWTEAGSPVPGFRPTWRSSNPAVAGVTDSGEVIGLEAGAAEIEAADAASGAADRVTIRVTPWRLEITPSNVELHAGEQARLTARALAADGRVLSASRFTWASSIKSVVGVADDGTVTAAAEGDATVTARLETFSAGIPVRVFRRRDYRLRRLLSTEIEEPAATIVGTSRLAVASNDGVAAITTLSNGAQALVRLDNGRLRTLAVTGQYLESIGRIISKLHQVSINARGDVAVHAEFPTEWCEQGILLFRGGQVERVFTSFNCDFSFTPRGLGDAGALVLRWSREITLREADGRYRRIVGIGDSLPGFTAPITGLASPFLTRTGVVAFEAVGATGRAWYLFENGRFLRLFGTGDNINGQVLSGYNLPVDNGAGDLYTRAILPNASGILRANASGRGLVVSGTNGINWVHDVLDARGDRVLFNGDLPNEGTVLGLYSSGGAQKLANTRHWRSALQGALTSTSGVIANLILPEDRGATVHRIADGADTSLVAPGASLNAPAPAGVIWEFFPRTMNPATLVTKATGEALVSIGQPSPIVTIGAALPGNATALLLSMFTGNAPGDLAFIADTNRGWGLYLWQRGRISLVADTQGAIKVGSNRKFDWFYGHHGRYLALNNRGDIAAMAQVSGFQDLVFLPAGSAVAESILTLNTAAPGGGNFTFIDHVAVDDAGRVAFQAGLNNNTRGVFLWEKGRLRRIAHTSEATVSGATPTDLSRVAASADRFYAMAFYAARPPEILSFDGTNWQRAVAAGYTLAGGHLVDGFLGQEYAVAPNNDLVYVAPNADGSAVLVRKADGRDAIVARVNERGPDGEWFQQLLRVAAGEGGEVFFSARVANGLRESLVLYQATPVR